MDCESCESLSQDFSRLEEELNDLTEICSALRTDRDDWKRSAELYRGKAAVTIAEKEALKSQLELTKSQLDRAREASALKNIRII